jgi:signal transduction histidine kinase
MRAPERAARPHYSLFRRYAAVLMALVGGALVIEGLFDMAFAYRESLQGAAEVQRAEVRAAAERIEQYFGGIERQVVQVSGLPWETGLLQLSERRDEYHRAMKLSPAISEVRDIGADGRERLRASRSALDEIGSGRDLSATPEFRHARASGAWYSPAFFREGSVPFLTLAVRDKAKDGDVTLAELNLKFVGDVVSRITIGQRGHVYAVDSENHLVAHPDLGLVLRRPDLSAYGALKRIRAELARSSVPVVGMFAGRGLEGSDTMMSAALIPSTQWLVIAEQPRAEVLEALYQSLVRALIVMGAGLLAAVAASYILARRLARPILELRGGAAKIAGGDLGTRIGIATGDEVEDLAHEFNRMADQLQDYTTRLERKVAEKTAELEMANRHKSEFLANMSHELRTPLNAIIGFSEVLKERMFGDLNPKQLEYVRDIYGSGQHLLSLINDILDLTKVEAGRMELNVHDFPVRAAIHNCCTLIRERAVRKRLQLESHVFEDVGTWCADERKFKQVVLNLLSNAVKFTPSGGQVRVVVRVEGDTLVVAVSDTGVGVAPDDQDRIFHSFEQAASDEELRQQGSGLGLALSRGLVERHGGTLTVESAPGRGATFVARFPRIASPAPVELEHA